MPDVEIVPMQLREIQASDGGAQIVVLAEDGGPREFPIYIGYYEMDALDRALHRKESPRPLTHDLVLNVVEGMGGTLVRVVVDDLRDETFYGKLDVRMRDGSRALIDSRPSDAIVLAMRRRVPIFVAAHVLDAANRERSPDE